MPSPTRLSALLFDIDGTLTDTEAVHFESWTRTLKPLGISVDPDHYMANFVGLTSEAIVARNFADIDPAIARRLPDEKEALFRSLLEKIVPTPGLGDLLAVARERRTHARQARPERDLRHAGHRRRACALQANPLP